MKQKTAFFKLGSRFTASSIFRASSIFQILALTGVLAITALSASSAFACPDVDTGAFAMADPDCNKKARVAFIGDSITSGVGAKSGKDFPSQVENSINSENFISLNIGVPGRDSQEYFRSLLKFIDRGGETTKKTMNLDFALISIGTNAYWNDLTGAQEAMRVLRLKKRFESLIEERYGIRPYVITARVPLTNRGFQNPFIRDLNANLKRLRGKLNLTVAFDTIPISQLGLEDDLHPNAKGYRKMARKARAGIKRAQRKARNSLVDNDADGLYDAAEISKFFTNILSPDTDDDGLTDGEEVNFHETNPNIADTDQDEVSDGDEIQNGTDPLNPESL